MSITLRFPKGGAEWRSIETAEGSLELLTRRPTAGDQLEFLLAGSPAERWLARLHATVTDWRGVEDEQGQPVPFSIESLVLLCSQIGAWTEVFTLVNDLCDVAPPKNSAGPSASGGTAEPSITRPLPDFSESLRSDGLPLASD